MKSQKSLSRAEVARRIPTLKVDAWKDLSGRIEGCSVNAWATGYRRRIERVSICALPKFGSNLTTAYRLAKRIKLLTGLTVHFHGGMIGGNL